MNRKDAEKMADDIFDMIDRNHPRGLIKSELVDLLAKFEPGVIETHPFPPKPHPDDPDEWQKLYKTEWKPLRDLIREARKAYAEVSVYQPMTEDDHWTEEIMERLHEVNRHFGKDLCGND